MCVAAEVNVSGKSFPESYSSAANMRVMQSNSQINKTKHTHTHKIKRRDPEGCIDPGSAFQLIQSISHQELLFISRILASKLAKGVLFIREYFFTSYKLAETGD